MTGIDSSAPVLTEINRRIAASPHGRITFAEFMELSLFSEDGYYTRRAHIGRQQDFSTSPELSPVFGASLADCAFLMWIEMGSPRHFPVIESGAGNGKLARPFVLRAKDRYPEFYEALRYVVHEFSPHLISKQKTELQGLPIQWVRGSAIDGSFRNVKGLFLSNELPDAFPVHRIKKINGTPVEIYVARNAAGQLVEVDGPISDEINDRFFLSVLDETEDGVERVASPGMRLWQQGLGTALECGYVITVDYIERQSAAGDRRPKMRTYGRNATADLSMMYLRPGRLDITSSINLAQMRVAGEESGLAWFGSSTQKAFINTLGTADELNAIVEDHKQQDIEYLDSKYPRNEFLDCLIAITSSKRAGRFAVAIQGKGVELPRLSALRNHSAGQLLMASRDCSAIGR